MDFLFFAHDDDFGSGCHSGARFVLGLIRAMVSATVSCHKSFPTCLVLFNCTASVLDLFG